MSLDAWTAGGLSWLLTYALHSTLWLLAAWCIASRLADGSERFSEWLWKVALLGGVITASLQVGMVAPLSGKLTLTLDTAEAEPEDVRSVQPAGLPELPDLVEAANTDEAREIEVDRASDAVDTEHEAFVPVETEQETAALFPFGWSEGLMLFWLIAGSVAVLTLLAAIVRLGLQWGLGAREIASGPLHETLAMLRANSGIRRPVRLLVSPRICGPLAMGVLRPQICVPQRALDELSATEQQAMLAHELAHIVRWDPLWLVICRMMEAVFFFQPLNRVARRQIQESAELLCDAWAVQQTGGNVSLARCLTEVAEWIVAARQPATAVAMATSGSGLGRRVRRLLENRLPERNARPLGLALLMLAVPLAAWALPGFATQAGTVHEATEAAAVVVDERPELPLSDHRSRPMGPHFEHSPYAAPMPEVQLEQLDRELAALESELALLREEIQHVPQLAGEIDGMIDRLINEVHRLQARRAELWQAMLHHREFVDPQPLSPESPR